MTRRILVISAFGCLIGLILGLGYAAHEHALGDEGKPVLWSHALTEYLSFWLGWGLLSGPIGALVHRFPISRRRKRNAIYLLAAAAVTGGEIGVAGLSLEGGLQGDVAFAHCLVDMGCTLVSTKPLTIRGGRLKGIDVDMNAISGP